eukprot:7090190-Prymnesium_polylepis.1
MPIGVVPMPPPSTLPVGAAAAGTPARPCRVGGRAAAAAHPHAHGAQPAAEHAAGGRRGRRCSRGALPRGRKRHGVSGRCTRGATESRRTNAAGRAEGGRRLRTVRALRCTGTILTGSCW